MHATRYQPWVRAALFLGAMYFVIGEAFAVPASHVRVWRRAAWVVSAVAYGSHIGYEHFRLRYSPRLIALHAALAVAIGALVLAVAGMIHSLSVTMAIRPSWLLALIIWPAVTSIPAFLVALVAASVLARVEPL